MSPAAEWGAIHELIKSKTDEQLGNLIREYIEESCHGGWDGFSSRDVTGIRRMLVDVSTYDLNRS